MARKVATARKMKSRQETTSLGQIAKVKAKPTISDKHLQTPTREVLKFRRATRDPPFGRASFRLLPCLRILKAPSIRIFIEISHRPIFRSISGYARRFF